MKLKKASVACLALLSAAGVATAQGAGAARPALPGAAGQAMTCPDPHIDGQLAFIKAELKITDEQAPVWTVFAETFRADKQKKAAACVAAQEQARAMASANLLDSMKVVETRLSDQLDSMRAMEAAIRPLYGMLTRDQKQKADEILKGGPAM